MQKRLMQKGLMSLTCYQRQLRNFWLAEFLIPSSLEAKKVRQREEGRENANAKNSFLPEIISNRQRKKKKKKESMGKPQAISIQVVYGENTISVH